MLARTHELLTATALLRNRQRHARFATCLFSGATGALALAVAADAAFALPNAARGVCGALYGVACVASVWLARRRVRVHDADMAAAAVALERDDPLAENALINAVQLSAGQPANGLTAALSRCEAARAECAAVRRPLPSLKRRSALLAPCAIAAAALVAVALLFPRAVATEARRFVAPWTDTPPYSRTTFEITPLHATVPRGGRLALTIHLGGQLPLSPRLVTVSAGRRAELPLADGVAGAYEATLAEMETPTDFFVEAETGRSATGHVDIGVDPPAPGRATPPSAGAPATAEALAGAQDRLAREMAGMNGLKGAMALANAQERERDLQRLARAAAEQAAEGNGDAGTPAVQAAAGAAQAAANQLNQAADGAMQQAATAATPADAARQGAEAARRLHAAAQRMRSAEEAGRLAREMGAIQVELEAMKRGASRGDRAEQARRLARAAAALDRLLRKEFGTSLARTGRAATPEGTGEGRTDEQEGTGAARIGSRRERAPRPAPLAPSGQDDPGAHPRTDGTALRLALPHCPEAYRQSAADYLNALRGSR